jgi:diaminopimelate decarboxylase
MAHIEIKVDCHIGSQLTELNPFMEAADKLLKLIDELAAEGIHIHHLDVGGGLGSTTAPSSRRTHRVCRGAQAEAGGPGSDPLVQPGRAIVANAGVLLTRVEYLKPGETRNFALIDAGMNDLLRPSSTAPG